MNGEAWSDDENDALVAVYFAMLADDIAGRPYKKAEHNRVLQNMIGRGRGAIEYKHQNLSAVLKGAGEAWIDGYKPAYNFQGSLVDAVARFLAARVDWTSLTYRAQTPGLSEASSLWFGPAPTLSNTPPPDETEQMSSVARRFDVAARDARNRKLGKAGERLVLASERSRLGAIGRPDLSARVRWVSDEDGDGAGFDIASFDENGRDRLIEVKTTTGWERTPFHISRNELAVSKERANEWCLVRVWDFARAPKAFELLPPLKRHVELMPTSFQASFH